MTDLSAASLLATAIGVVWTVLLGFIAKFLYDLAKSQNKLNERMAVVFTKIKVHDEAIGELKARVREIEVGGPDDA